MQPSLTDLRIRKLTLYIEANASYDYNDYYKQSLNKADAGYSDVNGQPSVLYKAVIDPKAVSGEIKPTLVGAGEVMGRDHAVHEDVSHVTTAKDLFDGSSCEIRFHSLSKSRFENSVGI